MSYTPGTKVSVPTVKSYQHAVPAGALTAGRPTDPQALLNRVEEDADLSLPFARGSWRSHVVVAGALPGAARLTAFLLAVLLLAVFLLAVFLLAVFRCASANGITQTARSIST